jgi:hypothetical protein
MHPFTSLFKFFAPVGDANDELAEAKLILKGIKETCDMQLTFPKKVFSKTQALAIKRKLRRSYAKLQAISITLNRKGIDPPTKWLNKRFYNSVINSIKEGVEHSILTPLQNILENKMKRI